ncbi:hypothetical protein [Kribbella pratensis]|jgi:hypothetical protein|uniref:Uncharacterized protein n=1 Tax=Kribbella pratensis TaxID=2512112 RepID=A0A4R8C496_9ACTN|nr:hypothetical protein [Kribbella pratensis]TDW70659.1 hypothetical protein EV653_4715 [Kribbella pratensis]
MTVGGVDTYYDYDEKQWKSRRLGGGPIRRGPVCPAPRTADHAVHDTTHERRASGRDHDVPKTTLH